jgi:hypothetical protein
MTTMLINILLYVMVLLRLWTAMVLIMTGRKNALTNLYWLAMAFVLFGAGAAFAPTAGNPLGLLPLSFWLFIGLSMVSVAAVIQFVRGTFYRGRPSPAPWMWGLWIILAGLSLYGVAVSASPDQQNPLVAAGQVLICIIFAWQAWAGYEAWREVAREKTVEDWIKGRYQLVVGYSLCQFVASLGSIVRILGAGGGSGNALGASMALVTLGFNIAVVGLSYLAWAAPAGFYRWLNRNYSAVEVKDINEEEVMRQLMGH